MLGENLTNIPDDISNSKLYELLLEANTSQTKDIKSEINNKVEEVAKKIEVVDSRVTALQNKVVTLERRCRRNNVVIFGLKVNEQDILKNTIDVLNNTLNCGILKTDINNIFYAKGNDLEDKKSHILVEFISYLKKQELFKNITKLKGTGIAIVNDLSYEDRQAKKILREHFNNARSQNLQAKIKGNRLEIDGKLFTLDDLLKLELQAVEETSEAEEGEEGNVKVNKREEKKILSKPRKPNKITYNNSQNERNLRSRIK